MNTTNDKPADLAQLWANLQAANAAVAAETRAALRRRQGPPALGPGSNYARARAAYRAFWDAPGADAFAAALAKGGAR